MGRVADPPAMSGFSARHCGSLRAADEGRDVELFGLVAPRRDMGGVIFIDLRDRWGKAQAVFNPAHAPAAHAAASDLRSEYVVRVSGVVRRRPSGSENPKLETGEIEVAASELEVLSASEPTPFPLEDSDEPDEKTRLENRYLHLRRPRMTRRIGLRNKVKRIIPDDMQERECNEVARPIPS